ncbi:MAG TPA: glycosyltransferase family 39 protein [Myxococcota bacterium]|nr:glycosyltransferase family 39 protein [Myxococcota bacterium]HOD06926.1 glycosyltransferase family 39 protein [Myxococcota bacterium]
MTHGIRKADILVGALLAACYFVMLMLTLDIGFPRDEGFYFKAGEEYSYWYDDLVTSPSTAFSKKSINKHFAYNPEHPALPKMMFGLSWRLFGKMHDPVKEPWSKVWYHKTKPPKPIFGIMSESTAMRLPALILNSLLVMFIFLFGVDFFSRRVGFVAAAAWMFLPHTFWHSHLACFDMPVTAMWFLVAWLFLKATPPLEERRKNRARTWKFAIAAGVAWGLSMSTKHNAWFIPAVFVIWYLIARWDEVLPRDANGRRRPAFGNIPPAFWMMLLLGPLVFYLTWPKLWFDPIDHLSFYIARHAKHEFYWAYFFGTLHTKPPFPISFPFVMSAMTIPGPIVLLSIAGLGTAFSQWIKRRQGREWKIAVPIPAAYRDTILFVFLNALIPFAIIAAPSTPIFGGTKHWLPGVAFLMLFVGIGFDLVVAAIDGLRERFRLRWGKSARAALVALCLAVVLTPAAFDTFHGHTNGSTYYNAFFGGFGAMGRHGMQREFWGNTAFSALPWLNRNAPKNAQVHFHDTAWDSVRMYWRDGLLRRDIKPRWDYQKADYFLFHWHKEFLDREETGRTALGSDIPAFVVEQDGVPLLNVYERPPRKPAPARLPVVRPEPPPGKQPPRDRAEEAPGGNNR